MKLLSMDDLIYANKTFLEIDKKSIKNLKLDMEGFSFYKCSLLYDTRF
jgi:hypothetical protein